MILIGCHDGYLRAYDESRKYDEGAGDEQVTIDAYAMFTPMMIGSLEHKGRVIRTTIVTGGGDVASDSMDYAIYVGDTAKKILDKTNTAEISGTVTGTGRVQDRNRAIGHYLGAYISNDNANESFGFESFIIDIVPAGRIK